MKCTNRQQKKSIISLALGVSGLLGAQNVTSSRIYLATSAISWKVFGTLTPLAPRKKGGYHAL